MDLWQQIEEYFSIIRHLNNIGLNPNKNFTNEHATEQNLAKEFGPKLNFKITNPTFRVDTWRELRELHWKIYGASQSTNNQFMLWLVRG
jgi:hypothetical protein